MARWGRPLAGVLALAAVFGTGLALGRHLEPAPERPAAALGPDTPTTVEIPELDVVAPVHGVGLAGDGSIAAPPLRRADEVGWYADGPAPGQYGAAVLVGHVDDTDGPAVFHRLSELGAGDRVEVTRGDGRRAVFEVTRVATYDKARLPAGEVYGDFRAPELRLITCGGRWVGGATGYAANVVVFARLVTG